MAAKGAAAPLPVVGRRSSAEVHNQGV